MDDGRSNVVAGNQIGNGDGALPAWAVFGLLGRRRKGRGSELTRRQSAQVWER